MYTLLYIVIPSNILIIICLLLMYKEWKSFGVFAYLSVAIICFLFLLLTVNLNDGVEKEGWLYDEINRDIKQLTSDGKYEYYIQFVNQTYNKKRYERLYLRNAQTGEEHYIRIKLNDGRPVPQIKVRYFTVLHPTDQNDIYKLVTTEGLKMPTKKFLVDIEQGTSFEID